METLQHFKRPWAHEHEPVKDLVNAVNVSSRFLSPITSFSTHGIVILIRFTSLGYQANGLDWIFWSWKNIYKRSRWSNGIDQRGLFLYSFLKNNSGLSKFRILQLVCCAATRYFRPLKPNITVRVYCRRGLYLE